MKINPFKALLITGASGVGKGEQVKLILADFPNVFELSVSATTRSKREYETEGKEYYFISEQKFLECKNKGLFAEWHKNDNGYYYGTLLSELDRIAVLQKVVLIDIEVHGALRIIEYCGQDNVFAIFIDADDDTRRKWLQQRNTETKESLEKRIVEGGVQRAMFAKNQTKFQLFIAATSYSIEEIFVEIRNAIEEVTAMNP
ncbi:guanylate kinase [Candidatus Nomurabacteria bacterium]|nr:guanylate kinase [Candidatus Nomurabacteria bacterium]